MKQFVLIVLTIFLLNNLHAEKKYDFARYNLKAINTRDIGLYDSSLIYLHAAIKISDNFQDTILCYISYSRTYYKLTDHYTAKLYLDSALSLSNQKDYSDYLPFINHNFGLIYTETGDFTEGLEYLYKALNSIPANIKGAVLNDLGRCYRFIGDVDSSTYYLKKAYNYKLKYYGINNYTTLLSAIELIDNTKDPHLIESIEIPLLILKNKYLLGRYYFIKRDYNKAEKYLSDDWFKLLQIYNESEQYIKAINALDSLRTSYTDIESKLFRQANERLIYKNAIDEVIKADLTEAFKLALKSRGNLLREDLKDNISDFPPSYNYFVFDSVIYLFLVNNKIDFYKIETDSSFFENFVKLINSLQLGNVYFEYYKGYRDFCESSYYIYKKLLPEIKENINIIPDGYLHYLPFEVLLTEFPADTTWPDFQILPYLMLKSDIHYDYILRNYEKIDSKLELTLLAPDKSLLYTQKLANKFWRYRGNICKGKKATTEMAKTGDILHIEAHYYPPDDYIRLADTNLLFNELDRLFDMVVISTCYSGFGKNYEGEGIFSPGRSFYKSGANCVIESIWSNDDISSYLIMNEFYKNLDKGYTKSRALKEAKITYFDICDPSKQHPYYWAHSRIFGDNQPLKIKKKAPILLLYTLGFVFIIVLIKYFFRILRKKSSS